MTDARTGRPYEVRPAFPRRRWLLGACASAAAWTFALPLTASSAIAFEPPAGGGLDAFTALSRQLTGRASLDATLASRIYGALAKADSAFVSDVAALNAWLKTHGGVPSDTVTAALAAEDARLSKTVGHIMRAWYLGLIGELPAVQVVAYEHALMFDPVADVLTVPSYCRDVPFYWTQKPTAS